MKAVIYARFSSDRQNEMSIEAQVRACKEFAESNNYEVIDVYSDEAISGTTSKRPAYQKLMRDAEKGKFDTILIHKYDRIARNLGIQVNLDYKLRGLGIELIAVAQNFGNTKEGKMMRGIQWVMGDYYIDNLSEEVRKGHKEIALRGLHNGGVAPFGYDIVDQKYVINPIEAPYVQKLFDAVLNRKGYVAIKKEMQENGIVGKRGKPISNNSINGILHNEKYTGVYLYSLEEEKVRHKRRTKPNAIRVEGAIPQLVSKEVFDEVQRLMASKYQTGHTVSKCSGLVYCGCGAKMYVGSSRKKDGQTYKYYRCDAKCGQKSVRVDTIEKMVDDYLKKLFSDEVKAEITKAMNKYCEDEEKMLLEFEQSRQEHLDEVDKKIESLTDNLTKGLLNDDVLEIISGKLSELKAQKERILKAKPVMAYSVSNVEGWLNSLINTKEEKIPEVLIEKIVVKDNKVEIISKLASLLETFDNDGNTQNKKPCGGMHGEFGCGGTLRTFPQLLYHYIITLQ